MFRDWWNTAELSEKNLTVKLYLLLAVTGFLRTFEMHRIDALRRLSRSSTSNLTRLFFLWSSLICLLSEI
ncbi:hypothetical protein AYI69_g2177 [Smittium culicis]|uniref:Uncharacterized protein n=1 Tax=Smittium culicis TaxID=133412 RepID=A0A1R1YN49_9FUNG|nr:hypothetical protein AYI69_g2177 [Smittium culicis]